MAQNLYTATIDLRQGVRMHRIGRLFAQNDKMAHRFDITILDDGVAADLTGLSTSAYFIRPDDGVVTVQGTISGNVVSVVLPSACYEVPGHFSMIIKIHSGQVTSASNITAVFWGDGTITRTETNIVIDPAHVVPNLDELLAQISTINAATTAANTAASSANTAASSANTAASNAQTKAGLADSAANSANTAAAAANSAATALDGMTVSATPSTTASATVSKVSGHFNIAFGLPQGEKGDKGDTGERGPSGSIASSASTVTLAASSWNSTYKTQSVTVSGMTSSSYVVVSPAPASHDMYAASWVRCTQQGTNSLTFACNVIPPSDLTVNIMIM